jgi:hypothetical protein
VLAGQGDSCLGSAPRWLASSGFRWLPACSGRANPVADRPRQCSNAILDNAQFQPESPATVDGASFKSPLDSGDLVMDNSSPLGERGVRDMRRGKQAEAPRLLSSF